MLFSEDKNLDDRVVELVMAGPVTISSLHKSLKGKNALSLRAVYKSVQKLIDAKVLLKVGKRVMIDHEWASRAAEELEKLTAPILSEGERVVYTFTSIEHLDTFWKTTVLPLERTFSTVREVFFYNPHNFWAYLPARKESEDAYYRHFSKVTIGGFFTVGGDSRADAEFKRQYQNDYLQVDLRNISQMKRTDHVTILGSYIVTVRLSKRVAMRIDQVYETGRSIQELVPDLLHICDKPGKIRFVIENNAKKAGILRKSLARNFYFRAPV